MTGLVHPKQATNRLLTLSLEHPVLVMLVLFVIASLIKVLDTFVWPINDLVGELILTKALGFVLVVAYLWACGRRLRDIGFRRRALGPSLWIATIGFVGLYVVCYGVQLIALRASGEEASLALTAVDPKTGMSGGLLFGLWLILANFVNSAMEEGLFRGLMVRHFLIPLSIWPAMLLQALLFAIWHLNWPIAHLLSGEATSGEAAFEATALLLSTGIAAIVYGYMYYKTGNLWGPFLGHTINNSVANVLFIRTADGLQAGLDFGLFIALFLLGHLMLIPVTGWLAKRYKTPEVKPWGAFDEEGEAILATA